MIGCFLWNWHEYLVGARKVPKQGVNLENEPMTNRATLCPKYNVIQQYMTYMVTSFNYCFNFYQLLHSVPNLSLIFLSYNLIASEALRGPPGPPKGPKRVL